MLHIRLPRLHVCFFSCTLAMLPGPAHAGPDKPPAAVVGSVSETYAGIAVADPYRHLEQVDSPETRAWTAAQAQYARATLDAIPGLPALRQRIDALDAASNDRIVNIQPIKSGAVFYLKRRAQDPAPKLYMRAGAAEKLVFDPEPLKASTGKSHAINNYSVAPDGRHVALVLSKEDAEVGAIQVMETASGKMVGAPVERIWGELPAIWLPDSKSFMYERSADPKRPYGKHQIHLRRVGSDGSDDQPLLGYDIKGSFAARENDWLFISITDSSPYAVLMAGEGVRSSRRAYVQPRARFGSPDAQWREVVSEADKVRELAHHGKWLYMRTFDGASRYRVMRRDLSRPDAPAVEVVPQQAGVIEEIGAAKDGLYYVVRDGAVSELFVLPHGAGAGAGKARKITMPVQGSLALFSASPEVNGVIFALEPWTAPMNLLSASAARPVAVDSGLMTARGEPYRDIVAVETSCPARDGAKVPMSILMKKGLARDGSNSTILYGYGGYGVTETADFQAPRLAFLERGGILAIANPRGSGAYGEDWYQAGRGATKANTWRDMIDCAEMLVRERYTSPSKLGIRGGSMGGVLAGRAITERPDLFATAIVQVGMLDAVRTITASQNGPNHLLEMGDVKTEAGVRQLLGMSSYHAVKDGTRYPAVLLTTGVNDNRVEPWMSYKMAARLQAADAGGKPILLRIDDKGGHGVSTTADQRRGLTADYYAFHLWQTGDPAFQPK